MDYSNMCLSVKVDFIRTHTLKNVKGLFSKLIIEFDNGKGQTVSFVNKITKI